MKPLLCFALLLIPIALPAHGQTPPVAPAGYEVVTKSIPHRDVRKTKILRGVKAPDGTMAIDYGIYSYIQPYAGRLFVVGKGLQKNQFILPETYGIYDTTSRQEIHPATAKQLIIHNDCVTEIWEASGKRILIDRQGKVLGGQRYRSVHFDKGQPVSWVSVGETGPTYGFVDSCGNPVTPLQYRRVGYFKEGFFSVCRDGKYTFIDGTGKEVMPPKYSYLTDFSNGVAAFSNHGSYDEAAGKYVGRDWGFINTRGEELGTVRYEQVANPVSFVVNAGKVDVKLDGQWVSVNPLATAQADGAPVVSGARWIAFRETARDPRDQRKQLWGFRVDGGEVMLKPKWAVATVFVDGLAIVGKMGRRLDPDSAIKQQEYLWGVIDETGREVIPLHYPEIRRFSGGLFVFAEETGLSFNERWRHGLMDRNGNIVLPALYSQFGELSEGLIAVRQDGRHRYIKINGETAFPGTFARALDFKHGNAPVSQDGKGWYWIDTSGKPILPGKTFLGLTYLVEGKAMVWTTLDAWGRTDGKQTIDSTGKVLVIHPLNPPPPPEERRCPTCGGSGGRFAEFERSSTTTEVDNYNANAPGAKLIIERTKTWTETKRVGECWTCDGKGTVMR